jgi:EmrB/QacA subfamily drug resistance transporter
VSTAEIAQLSVTPQALSGSVAAGAAHTAHTANADPPVEPKEHRSWSVLCVALAAQVLVVLDISVVNTALPTIGRELNLGSHDLQWLVTAYLLTSGGGLLLGGRIADLLPRRLVFLVGLALFTAASFVAGIAGSAGVLVAARATQGLGAAAMTPAALSLIMTFYSGAQRTKGLALWGAVGSMGVAAGVLLGGALTTWAGWQAIFWINVPVGVAAFAAALFLLPRQTVERAGLSRLDLPGGVTAIAALGALLLGIQGTSEHGWTSAYSLGLFAVATALATAFLAIERRVASPLVPPHTWKVKTLLSGTSVMLGATGILVGVIFLTSIFAQTVLGYSALEAGLVFLPLALVMAAAAHAAGRLMGKLSSRVIAVVGLSLSVGGALLLAGAPVGGHFATDLLPGLLTLGFGIGLVFVSVSVTAMAGIPAQHAGMASGFLMTGHELGAALGVAVVSAVAATAGSLTSASGAADAFSRGLVATAVIGVVVAVVAFVTLPAKPQATGAGMHMHH